jgi:hypothetical protein
LISSRLTAGHGIARASACARLVFPEPGGPLTTTSVGFANSAVRIALAVDPPS